MDPLRLQVRTLHKPYDPIREEAAGQSLASVVRAALDRGSAPPVAVVVRPDRVDLFGLEPVMKAKIPLAGFLAGLSRAEMEGAAPPYAVGLIGRFTYRGKKKGPGIPMAMVFLEWSDCRWWQWRVLIDAKGTGLLDDTETIISAAAGHPKPPNLGGWWSIGRRQKMSVKLAASGAAGPVH